jgi:hypothetical protein
MYIAYVVHEISDMSNEHNSAEELMPSERLAIQLTNIENDIQLGKISIACTALRKIKASQITKFPNLKSRYDRLRQYCP